jgi:hypothetical protein
MSETKECVACAEEILAKAKLCKHCGTKQDTTEFSENPSLELVPHECNHRTLDDVAREYRGTFSGGPKLKEASFTHGQEQVLGRVAKAKLSADSVLEQEMIITDKTLILAGYGSFGKYEEYPLNSITGIWLAEADISMGYSESIGLVLVFETQDDSIEPRIFMLGSAGRAQAIKEALDKILVELQSIAGHIPIGWSGEKIVGGYTIEHSFGIITSFD